MDEDLIQVCTMATRDACVRMTTARLRALHDSVEYASCLTGGSGWGQRAAAHAEIFTLLADMTDGADLATVMPATTDVVYDAVGPVAHGMIVSSRRRLLAHMRAGDADGAALEMERHLRTLVFMWRLALPGRQEAWCEALA
jgi:DNA-binding GntR family transcriptional regulator